MKKRLLAVLMLLGVLGLVIQPAIVLAQDYLFDVTRAQVNFFIQEDGTAAIEYYYDFSNRPIRACHRVCGHRRSPNQ